MCESLRKVIVSTNDKIQNWILYRPLRKERDPAKRLEIRLWIEISGASLGGMAASGAHVNFKKYYYEKLPSDEAKSEVRKALLSMLKSKKYNIFKKEAIAYVCSDLRVEDSEEEVSLVREASARGLTMEQLLALKRKQKADKEKHNLA